MKKFFSFIVVGFIFLGFAVAFPENIYSQAIIIVDHRRTGITKVPVYWIERFKADLRILWPHFTCQYNLILYNFADIESYAPAGACYPNESDVCSWCSAWYNSQHTRPFDCDMPCCEDYLRSYELNCKLSWRELKINFLKKLVSK